MIIQKSINDSEHFDRSNENKLPTDSFDCSKASNFHADSWNNINFESSISSSKWCLIFLYFWQSIFV